jgi:Ca2+-binding RTX toxin-like protein
MAGKFLRLGRGRLGIRAAAVLGLTTLLSLALVAPASAAVSCAWLAGTLTITLGAGDSVTVSVGTSNNILVNGDDTDTGGVCETGAVHTTVDTTTIAIDGSTGNETATISQAGTAAFPATMGFDVDLAAGTGDALVITGASGVDTITFGATGISIDADATSDITRTEIENFTVNAGAGNDTVSGAGSASVGAAFVLVLTLNGEGDADTLTGGSANDSLSGGAGNDRINGGPGSDRCKGGPGRDKIVKCER